MEKTECSYTDEKGMEINTCEDMPVTYCPKCNTLYVVSEDGTRTEIASDSNTEEEENEAEGDEVLFN